SRQAARAAALARVPLGAPMKGKREKARGKPRRDKGKVRRRRARSAARRSGWLPRFSRKVFRRGRRRLRRLKRLKQGLVTVASTARAWCVAVLRRAGYGLRWLGERLQEAGDALARLDQLPSVEPVEVAQPAVEREVGH